MAYKSLVMGSFLFWLCSASVACACGGRQEAWPLNARLELLWWGLALTGTVFAVYVLMMFWWGFFNKKWVIGCGVLALLHVLAVVWWFESGSVVVLGFYGAGEALLAHMMLVSLPLLQAAYHVLNQRQTSNHT